MRIVYYIFTLLIISYGCTDYNSDRYLNYEYEAINDLIYEMTDYKFMSEANGYKNEKVKLYISSILNTSTAEIIEPNGYITGSNGIRHPEDLIAELEEKYDDEIKDCNIESKKFNKLIAGEIQPRRIDYEFKSPNLVIELSENSNIFLHNLRDKDFGCLEISRIIFNYKFTKGYLHYTFYCGQGCLWDYNIEIRKVNGKWKIFKIYSGGIA